LPYPTLFRAGVGAPLGTDEAQRVAEQLAGFTGLGVVIAFLAGLAMGRFTASRAPEAAEPPEGGRPGSGTTQPLVYGRYARENPPGSAAPPPLPGDRPIAGETPPER